MFDIKSMTIDLKGLKQDDISLVFNLDDAYFGAIGGSEVRSGTVRLKLDIHRSVGFFELQFHCEGIVIVPCDICLDDMEQTISTDNRLIVKLGEEYSEDDDIITVEKDDALLDISWLVYEFIALGVPIKHVHTPGKCNPAMIKALEEHTAARSSDGAQNAATDPRWSELEKLKTIIKD